MAEKEIRLVVKTESLKKAVGDINQFEQSAKSAGVAAEKLSASTSKVAKTNTTTLKTNGNELTRLIKEERLQEAINKRETAELKKQTAELKLQNSLKTAARGQVRKFDKLATGVDTRTGQMARDLGVNRFNTANIAAQFQDIGVTAAMGMNPMTIALQQGTQLSAILNNMGNPLKGLAQAFTQLINPVALLSIGITGLIAALIQMVDWGKVWETSSGLIANGLDFLADNFYLLATAMGTFLGIQVLTHLSAIYTSVAALGSVVVKATEGLLTMGKAWLVAIGPVGWAVLGITALVGVLTVFRKEITELLGFDLIGSIKNGINGLITNFRNGLQVLLNITTNFVNLVKKAFYEMQDLALSNKKIALTVGSFGGLGLDVSDPSGALAKEFAKIENERKALHNYIEQQNLPSLSDILLKDIEDPTQPKDYLGNAVDGIGNVLHKLADKLRSSGDDVSDAMKKAWEKIVKGVEGHKIEMTQEADLLGRIGEDYYITKEKYDLLNQAREAGITLTSQQTKYIEEESIKLGQQADALAKLTERFDFAKSATNSFFTDMNHALIEGKNMWEAFGSAVTNVLTKILDKITEIGVDALFAAGKAGGWFGFGSTGQQVYETPIGPSLTGAPMALGGAWNKGVQMFATGGIVGSPTMFGTRNGLGLMGEAGPEAIMPLTRGANGELGVKAEGVGGSPVVVNVINNSNSKATVNQRQTSQGTEIDVMIDQLVADKLGTLGTASNTAMNTWNNRQLIAR